MRGSGKKSSRIGCPEIYTDYFTKVLSYYLLLILSAGGLDECEGGDKKKEEIEDSGPSEGR